MLQGRYTNRKALQQTTVALQRFRLLSRSALRAADRRKIDSAERKSMKLKKKKDVS